MLKNVIIMLVCVFMISACGGSSSTSSNDDGSTTADTTAPTISSVTTDNGNADTALSSTAGDDRVSGAVSTEFFTITFSEAMDPTTVIADNVTLTCNDAAITIGTPATSDNIIWTIPVESALTGYVGCTLTLSGTGLKDAAGNALGTDATYAFNTQCSTNDIFIVDTLGFADASDTIGNCWSYAVTGSPPPSNSSTSFSVAILDGALEFISPDGSDDKSDLHRLFKTFSATSFTATVEIIGMSTGGNLNCSLTARDSGGTQNASVMTLTGTNCQLDVNNNIGGPASPCSPTPEAATPTSPLYLQLAWDGTIATGKQGPSLSSLTALTPPGSNTASLGSSYQVGFECGADAANKTLRVSSFTINAAAAATTGTGTQY